MRLEDSASTVVSAEGGARCIRVGGRVRIARPGAARELGDAMGRGDAQHLTASADRWRSRACRKAPMSGAYVVTGGLGGLGLRALALLVERGVSRVVLASRSGRVARSEGGSELAALLWRSRDKCGGLR